MSGRLAALGLLAVAACQAAPPPIEKVLKSDRTDPASATELLTLARERARAARSAALARPGDVSAQVEAARALFTLADLRMWTTALQVLDETPPRTVADVLYVEGRLGHATGEDVRSLCTEGLAATERALAIAPGDAAALLYRALNLGLVAWAEGPTRSVLSGRGAGISNAISRALAADPLLEAAAPLRLSGRFRTVAPWPLRDLERAREELVRATRAHPVPIHHLFLGDVDWADEDKDGARANWTRASEAPDDPFTPLTNDLYRELARRRIAAGRAK